MAVVPHIDLKGEYLIHKAEIDQAIQRVLESGTYVLGEELESFEEDFARYCGTRFAVGVGSGTASIQLALAACGVGPGDEVITVPNSDMPTSMAINHCGARPVWVDVDARTFNMDPARVEEKITPRTKAILPVHLAGHPADMDPILEIARRHQLVVIEDAALAAGAQYRGRKTGSLGHAGCFSLAPSKVLGGYGDAGIVTTDDEEIARQIKMLRNYGKHLGKGERQLTPGGDEPLQIIAEGYNERLDTLHAAILHAKLPTLEQRLSGRRWAAGRYDELLQGLPVTLPYAAPDAKHAYRSYTLLVEDRDRLLARLAQRGIEARIFYVPLLHLQPVYREMQLGPGSFPVAEDVADHMLCLPIFPHISEAQIQTVVDGLKECLAEGIGNRE